MHYLKLTTTENYKILTNINWKKISLFSLFLKYSKLFLKLKEIN